MLWIQIILFAVLAWCGLYLLSRDIRNPRLWGAGIGTSLTAIGLGTGMLIPFATPLQIGLHIIGTGLLILSVTLLRQESRKRGEAWLPDVMRAFDYSFFFALIFSGQVALVIALGPGFTRGMLLLLLISIVSSIAFQVFGYPLRALLDRVALAMFPKLLQDRSRLRLVEQVQLHIDGKADPGRMRNDDLLRYTKLALRHFGDLQRLATNPLTRLPLIERRLAERGAADEVIERAVELKAVLLESIAQLKPRGGPAFGTTDEWRHYNVLYFPYIVGIKPYSVRYSGDRLDAASREALEWFRTSVPERTYYNWQTAAAKLVALSLTNPKQAG